jgi:preprotein translocase subunit SecG
MLIFLLVIHVFIALALIGVILLQKSEGGALGIGGGGMSGFMTGRSTANLLTRATAILAALFMTTSILLVVLRTRAQAPPSIIGEGVPAIPAGVPAGVPSSPLAPPVPSGPAPVRPTPPGPPAAPSPPLAH